MLLMQPSKAFPNFLLSLSIACPCTRRVLYLHVGGGGGTSDNLDQLASNDGLTSSVVENLVLANHLSSVLRGVLQGYVSNLIDHNGDQTSTL